MTFRTGDMGNTFGLLAFWSEVLMPWREANLSRSNLSVADLSGVNLGGADLSRANLWSTNPGGANLSGANLSEASGLSQQQLDGACAAPRSPPANIPVGLEWNGGPCPTK